MKAKTSLKFTDHSTPHSFQFAFHCQRCGAGVWGERYTFNTQGFIQPLNDKARALLWIRQHKEAYARARHETRFDFNLCPACGRYVCSRCFHLDVNGAADICIDCKQQEKPLRPKRLFLFR